MAVSMVGVVAATSATVCIVHRLDALERQIEMSRDKTNRTVEWAAILGVYLWLLLIIAILDIG